MCVAATGKVVKIDKEIAEVDFNGNIVRAHTGIIDVKGRRRCTCTRRTYNSGYEQKRCRGNEKII